MTYEIDKTVDTVVKNQEIISKWTIDLALEQNGVLFKLKNIPADLTIDKLLSTMLCFKNDKNNKEVEIDVSKYIEENE